MAANVPRFERHGRGGGGVIHIASAAGMVAGQTPPMVAHSAANAGVIAMTRQFALEGEPSGPGVRFTEAGP